MKIRNTNIKRTAKDNLINAIYYEPKVLDIMMGLVYYSPPVILFCSLIWMYLIQNWIFGIFSLIFLVFSINNLLKYLKFKKYGLYKNQSYFDYLKNMFGK